MTCVFPGCDGHDDRLDALVHGQHAVIRALERLGPVLDATARSLTRMERALRALRNEQEHDMSELDDRLADLKAAADTNTAKLARLIDDFENAGNLTADQTAALDALKAELVDNAAAIDAADPEPAPPAEPTA